ncbi:MAG: hypothetical protein CMH64_02675 [Nanoarchaeota archaeon]|nr:hypothetical protein [Nanoarchaeota archaeon]
MPILKEKQIKCGESKMWKEIKESYIENFEGYSARDDLEYSYKMSSLWLRQGLCWAAGLFTKKATPKLINLLDEEIDLRNRYQNVINKETFSKSLLEIVERKTELEKLQ